MALGITQTQLAKAVGLTFQQIQKYESGANQLVSSRLYELASVLRVPVAFFFEGLRSEKSGVANLASLSLMATVEAQRLILSYWRIGDDGVRKQVRDLVLSLSNGADVGARHRPGRLRSAHASKSAAGRASAHR